ncbi:Epimerase family protein [Solibacillus isronensis B3W22]|uniref:Epimerase family protein n=1 Tax=Solibacillus isronensis B3W22 TaxID=1224748 RepID=K1L035_9BACL|nr:TIGR01777 family oxidoreductase [Solibacillus isronensis]AMO86920.1 epimerase [Solibacillus silvestris]EKB45497.1 Epimerase family protein [Solibacillus isronensis B3W22]
MKVAIAGGTGMVGRRLSKLLLEKGHEVIILTRGEQQVKNNIHYVQWLNDDSTPELFMENTDAFVNLAGVSLNEGRWTDEQKQKILSSRIESTDEVIRILQNLMDKPKVLINASAVGIYPVSEKAVYTEQAPEKASDFLGSVVVQWEERAMQAQQLGIRTCLTRFGVILEKGEGALPMMILPYKLGVGGTIGSGRQWLSWIHVEDVARAILFAIENDTLSGPINFTTPNVKRMKQFGQSISHALKRPHWFPVPSIALKIALGEKSMLVLEGQHVLPEKLLNANFEFKFISVEDAIRDLYE